MKRHFFSRIVRSSISCFSVTVRTLLLCFVLCAFSSASYGAVITVPGDYSSIQTAIDASVDDDEIIVSPGEYRENINFGGKNIVLRSTDPTDPDVVANTIIDGYSRGSVVTFAGTETPDCVLCGFTLQSGRTVDGGGISGNGTLATIRNNDIFSNFADRGGGLYGCNGVVENNRVRRNSGDYGGGLYRCNGTVRNNIISRNTGSGLYECNGTIENNVIRYNHTGIMSPSTRRNPGSGLNRCSGTIRNNTVVGNWTKHDGGGLYDCSGLIVNCIIWGNRADGDGDQVYDCSTPLYSCIQGWTGGGTGNISADPRLDTGEDQRLLPDSPCIDAGSFIGDLPVDLDGDPRGIDGSPEPRGDGSDYDIGADEYVPDDWPVTIQGMIDAAAEGDVIIVPPGVYVENIDFGGKNIVLRSTDPSDPDVVANTIIDGSQAGPVVTFAGTESPACVIAGFTITHGGQGIRGNSTLATIQDNVITVNRSGGVYECNGLIERNTISHNFPSGLSRCDGVIRENTISGNTGRYGGGLSDCNGIIENNTVCDNSADEGGGFWLCIGLIQDNIICDNSADYGGGLNACSQEMDPPATIRNNIIYNNIAEYGGGLYWCFASIDNNIIYGNTADYGGGLYDCSGTIRNNTVWGNAAECGGGFGWCIGTVENCIIWNNTASFGPQLYFSAAPAYSCIQDWAEGGIGNITEDPLLVDPIDGDFHLQADSPCIDAGRYVGDLVGDFEGDLRGFDGTVEARGDGSDYDIGADEYADTDGDGLPDWVETNTGTYVDETDTGTDPDNPDTDGDGLGDGEEINTYLTNPVSADTDGDGFTDGDEILRGTDPLDPDAFPVNRGGSCFIATAAYGTASAREVGVLCEFRDRYLMTNRAGAACVRAYYRLGPPVARFIAAREPLRAIVRACLTPVAAVAGLAVNFPQTLAFVTLGVAAFGVMLLTSKRQRSLSLRRQS